MKQLHYLVMKEKGSSRYYVAFIPGEIPVKGTYGDKKKVLKLAADLKNITTKEYIKLRKDYENGKS